MQMLFSYTKSEAEITDSAKTPRFSKAIEDNSFLIEEAYNQEDRVIQHISNLVYSKEQSNSYFYSFTEEWPFFSQKHQLSFTLLYSFLNNNSVSGLGDIYLNYRYQLFEHDDWITAAPRLSVILPTGSKEKALGGGVTGFQCNLPFSKRLNEYFTAHANLGMTILPNSKGVDFSGNEIKKTLSSYNYGASLIWLMSYNVNFMLEYTGNILGVITENGEISHNTVHTVSPGLRFAIDLNNLQIVPGIAVPVSFQDGRTRADLFTYLSFEHPI